MSWLRSLFIGRTHPEAFMPVVVFCLSLALLAVGAAIKGPVYGFDTQSYLLAGEKLFSWAAQGQLTAEHLDQLFVVPGYLISTIVLTGVYSYWGMGAAGMMALNSLLFSLIACMVFALWNSVHGVWRNVHGRAGLAAWTIGGAYIVFGLPDALQWSYAVLTDAIFVFWIAVFVFATAVGLLEGNRRMWALAGFMAVTAPFVRPTGILAPLLYLFALGIHAIPAIRGRFRAVVGASIVLPSVFVFLVIPWLVIAAANDPSFVRAWIPPVVRGHFMQAVWFFTNGIVIADRLQFPVSEPITYTEILRTVVVRLAYFWVPLRFGEIPYSTMHNIVNLVYIVLTWPLAVIGTVHLSKLGIRCRLMALFLVEVALAYALLHSVTLISYDWRYQLPAMVPYWILAGCGYYRVVDLLRKGWDARRISDQVAPDGTLMTGAAGSRRGSLRRR